MIGSLNLKLYSLRRDPMRQAPSATLHISHEFALNNAGQRRTAKGSLARQVFHAFANQSRGVQRLLLCLSHQQPVAQVRTSPSIRFVAAAGKPYGFDTGHLRPVEPQSPCKTNHSGSPQSHTHVGRRFIAD